VKTRTKTVSKPYLVGIPVPYLDRNGRKLGPRKTKAWTKAALVELTKCFGGATPQAAAATNIVEGRLLYEEGQTLVLSGCDSRDEFLQHRERIKLFGERMCAALNQYAVFVLAYPSDCFLIEVEAAQTKRRRKT
jgi:hypothetical protein